MEAEVRAIPAERLASPTPSCGLGSHIHARFAGLGGAELDTNVLSELARIDPEPVVVTWLDSLPAAEAATAIAAAELLYGVARLSDGRRRAALAETIDVLINEDFRGRLEPFDGLAAEQYADIVVGREKKGRPISTADTQIAAICRVYSATLATRNIGDFTDTGIVPWPTRPAQVTWDASLI